MDSRLRACRQAIRRGATASHNGRHACRARVAKQEIVSSSVSGRTPRNDIKRDSFVIASPDLLGRGNLNSQQQTLVTSPFAGMTRSQMQLFATKMENIKNPPRFDRKARRATNNKCTDSSETAKNNWHKSQVADTVMQ